MADFEYQADRVLRALVIAADEAAARPARDVLEATGVRLLDTLEPGAPLGDGAALDLVLLEAAALDAAALDDLLPRLDALSNDAQVHIIAAITSAQIDQVSRHLLGRDAQILCAPGTAQRALAVMVSKSSVLKGVGQGDRDGERLRQLNEEVARIAETLARLARSEPPESENAVSDRRPGYRGREVAPDAVVEAKDIRDAIRSRRMRDQYFETGLFGDPAWDMLLDLFAASLEGARVSVSSLCIAAAVAPTTALRWIGRMTDAGLFVRTPDPDDRRRAFIDLSDTAVRAVRDYCTAAKRQGLPIA